MKIKNSKMAWVNVSSVYFCKSIAKSWHKEIMHTTFFFDYFHLKWNYLNDIEKHHCQLHYNT